MLKRGHQQDDPYLPTRQGVGAMQKERLNPSALLGSPPDRSPPHLPGGLPVAKGGREIGRKRPEVRTIAGTLIAEPSITTILIPAPSAHIRPYVAAQIWK